MKTFPTLVGLALLLSAASLAQAPELEGAVRDPAGAAVAGADVLVTSATGEQRTQTDDRGEFHLAPGRPARVEVRKAGFATTSVAWPPKERAVTIVLHPAHDEEITVRAMRTPQPVDAVSADVAVLERAELGSMAADTVDDLLRYVPGFSLFRRSGSRVANPTTQGVALRGLGASGASRALVLRDGVPLNDPFGGWVYWGRVPLLAVDRVEVLRGGASELYGSDALSGVVALFTASPARNGASLDLALGNERTPQGSVVASLSAGNWRSTLAGEVFSTGGYFLVNDATRGAVDTRAASRHQSGSLTIDRQLGGSRVFASGEFYGESRDNGTRLQTNRTGLGELVLGADVEAGGGTLALRGYGSGQRYNQSFSAVTPDRESESLTDRQRVPAQQAGGSAQWSRALAARSTLVAGVDLRDVRGDSNEMIFSQDTPLRHVDAGGNALSAGVFAQGILQASRRLTVTLGAREDWWRHTDGFSVIQPLAQPGATIGQRLPDRSEDAFSPSLGLHYRVSDAWSLTGSAYRSFRAPTLNELYRNFRVGNVLTLANDGLRAERLTGAEGGVRFRRGRSSVAATLYWAGVERPVANVTLAVTPSLITRQRQNLGETQTTGIELEVKERISEHLALGAGYLFADAVVTRFDASPALVGREVPQVPRHQLSLQGRYERSRWAIAAQGRAVGRQFDDDLNLLPLHAFFALDTFLSWRAARGTEIYVAAENVLDQRYEVGRTPVTTLGPPALVRCGVRLHLDARH